MPRARARFNYSSVRVYARGVPYNFLKKNYKVNSDSPPPFLTGWGGILERQVHRISIEF